MAISLQKGQKVNLKKAASSGLGEILVNLNWNAKPAKKGLLGTLFGGSQGIDLDLGCLYELKDGQKGAVQALGNGFGALNRPPYIALDGDDRTGAAAAGENLRINGDQIGNIKGFLSILLFMKALPTGSRQTQLLPSAIQGRRIWW